jgi:hypothetical protein
VNSHSSGRLALAAASLSLLALTACSGGSAATTAPGGDGATVLGAGGASTAAGQVPGKTVNGCTLVTAKQLSQAVGVKYTAIQYTGTGSICNVTGASATDSFFYQVDKEDGTITTWSSEVAVIKQDDGAETSVSGIGTRAAQGAIKEFAAESDGYIVVVVTSSSSTPTSTTRPPPAVSPAPR